MKKWLVVLIILLSCSTKEKTKNRQHSDIDECDHSEDYGYCDNLDTAIKHYKEVSQLFIYRKEYNVLSDSIVKLKYLKGLSISNQTKIDWGKLFDRLSTLDSLETLDIENCKIRNLQNIGKLRNLKKLSILDTTSFLFPIGILQCSSLEELEIYNNMQALPNQISQLVNLKKIVIRSKVLDNIPMGLFALSKMEDLDLAESNIDYIPKHIIKLKKLTKFSIYNTPIGEREFIYFKKNKKYQEIEFIPENLPKCRLILKQPLPPL